MARGSVRQGWLSGEGEGLYPSHVAAERLLLIHFNGPVRERLCEQLADVGYSARGVRTIDDGIDVLTRDSAFPIVLVVACGDASRMRSAYDELVESIALLQAESTTSQILLVCDSSVDITWCCHAINNGVAGFIEYEDGGIPTERLQSRLDHALARYERAVADARRINDGTLADRTGIIGVSSGMARILSQAARAAEVSDAPVLIYGESGTGKQLLAEMVHRLDSKRGHKSFLSVNCAAITGSLAESALFGHVKGAFTGATEPRAGYFRAAEGGTVFLDEVGELCPTLQPKLLRVLQEGMVMPVGSDQEHAVDVRVIAASNRRIPALVEAGDFRLDLYQRLNVIALDLPPLHERQEDIPLLVDFFVKKYADLYGKPVRRVDRRVYELLADTSLDGNVRELENTIRRALAIKDHGAELTLADLPASLIARHGQHLVEQAPIIDKDTIKNACQLITSGRISLPEFIEQCERLVLAHAMKSNEMDHTDLSKQLGVSTRTLYNKRRKYGL